MLSLFVQMAALIFCGIAWRVLKPGGVDADTARRVLTVLVFYFLLPILVLSVLWTAELGIRVFKISLFGTAVIFFGAALVWLATRCYRLEPRRLGAATLGVAFANVTYMGLPVLEHLFGPWARAIVIQIDLFSTMPLVLTYGTVVSRHYGTRRSGETKAWFRPLFQAPPLWAAAAAVALNVGEVPKPAWVESALAPLNGAVAPLMLIALGMGLRWSAWHPGNFWPLFGVLLFRLLVVPALALSLARGMGFTGDTLTALVLEAAMPCMLLGIVYCDRYHLDTAFYALAVTLTTLFGMLSLPFWYRYASAL